MHVAGGRIDAQFTEAQGAIAWLDPAVAAQMGAQPGQQHPRFDRLADVVVGAQFQPQHLVDVVGTGAQHADDPVIVGPDLPTHFETILARQADVEQDQRRLFAEDPGDRALAAALMGDLVTVALQVVADHRAQPSVVFNQYDIQHLQGLRGASVPPWHERGDAIPAVGPPGSRRRAPFSRGCWRTGRASGRATTWLQRSNRDVTKRYARRACGDGR
ncbi:hypothetical protein D3C72_1268130 [compost metagenome]